MICVLQSILLRAQQMNEEILTKFQQWFDVKDFKELRQVCLSYLEPLEFQLKSHIFEDINSSNDLDWNTIYEQLDEWVTPPAIRALLMQYLSGFFSFIAQSNTQGLTWLTQPKQRFFQLQSPSEKAAALNLFLKKYLSGDPSCWLKTAESPLGDWLPLKLLTAAPNGLSELIPALSNALLIEDGLIQSDLDYLMNLPSIKFFSNTRDQIENDLFNILQSQCNELSEGKMETSFIENYYSQVRLFFSTFTVFVDWHAADKALLDCLVDENPLLRVIPAEYRRKLLDRALIQVPHNKKPLALCPYSKIPLFKNQFNQWQTLCNDPDIKKKIEISVSAPHFDDSFENLSEYFSIHPEIIRDWYIPGQLELQIATAARSAGWKVTLWPKRDQIDVLCEHPDCTFSLAIDGKDWKNSYLLGRSFSNFKSFSDAENFICLIVVPDYRLNQPQYRERFEGGQAQKGNKFRLIDLTTFTQLVKKPAIISANSFENKT